MLSVVEESIAANSRQGKGDLFVAGLQCVGCLRILVVTFETSLIYLKKSSLIRLLGCPGS